MKREIKFRARRAEIPIGWVYGYFIIKNGQCKIINDEGEFPVIVGTEQQFTGLKDKNGIDIYEGDIIKYKKYDVYRRWWSNISEIAKIEKECEKQRKNFTTVKEVVKFDNGCFILNYDINFLDIANGQKFKTGQTHGCDTEEKRWDFEVIGNIHENPGLLESTK